MAAALKTRQTGRVSILNMGQSASAIQTCAMVSIDTIESMGPSRAVRYNSSITLYSLSLGHDFQSRVLNNNVALYILLVSPHLYDLSSSF